MQTYLPDLSCELHLVETGSQFSEKSIFQCGNLPHGEICLPPLP